jgi:lipopolysaccharide heptosyltransferase II
MRPGAFRPPVTPPLSMNLPARTDIRRILILKWSALGDVVIATTAMEDIRRAFPDASIDLNTMPAFTGLFAHDPRFAEVFALDLRGAEGGMKGTLKWLKRVRAARYDLVVDLQSNERSRFLVGMLKVLPGRPRFRIGIRGRFPYNVRPTPLPEPWHVFDLTREALKEAGIPTVTTHPVLHVPPEREAAAKELMAEVGLEAGRFAVFLPGSQAAGYLKRWGAERYAALGKLLHAKGLDKVAVIGGPDEVEECARLTDAIGADWAVNLCGRTRILDIVPIVRAARFVVGNDTGTGHVASAAGGPITVICGPTDPNRVKPVGEKIATLQADLPCINCYCKAPCDHHSCMREISPEQVAETVAPYL